MLDIEYPILLAGMGGMGGPVAGPELVAAVSNAGGLGILGCAFLPPNKIEDMIRETRKLTDKPFGIDTVLPAEAPQTGTTAEMRAEVPAQHSEEANVIPEIMQELELSVPKQRTQKSLSDVADDTVFTGDLFKEEIEIILEYRVPVYAAGLGDPGPYMDEFRKRGIKVIGVVGHTRSARRVAKSGVDIIVAQGRDAGGHTSRIGTIALIPQVVDVVSPIPVVAAGGIGDGRGLVASLALGAVGVWCGTIFLATPESLYEDYQKQSIVDASEDDTVVSRVITGKEARIYKNSLAAAWAKRGLPTLPMPLQTIVVLPILDAAFEARRADIVPTPAGQISGIVNELKPAGQIVEEMVASAHQVLEEFWNMKPA
jgi:NAD(P)H-dependent flavin oxidoreductase YrpB (nitropropane dioxygenase family)